MIYKSQIPALFAIVQAYVPDAMVVASEGTALVLHGLMDNTDRAYFDVSSTLFTKAAAEHHCFIAMIGGHRTIQIGHELTLREGPYMDKTSIDGVPVYTLAGMRVRCEIRGRSGAVGDRFYLTMAHDIAKLQEKLANPMPAPVAPVKPGPTWGELNAEETAYEAQCDRADWYYGYSDDLRVYKAGKARCEALQATAEEKGGNYAKIYKYHSSK